MASRTPASETSSAAWARAISRLQLANAAVLDCPTLDLGALSVAMLEREAAVRMIAHLQPEPVPEAELARFRVACEAGARIREKLGSVRVAVQARFEHLRRLRSFVET